MADDKNIDENKSRRFNDFPWNATRDLQSGGYLKKHPDRLLFVERNDNAELYVGEILGHGTWGEKMRKSKLDDLEAFDPELYTFCVNSLAEDGDYFG